MEPRQPKGCAGSLALSTPSDKREWREMKTLSVQLKVMVHIYWHMMHSLCTVSPPLCAMPLALVLCFITLPYFILDCVHIVLGNVQVGTDGGYEEMVKLSVFCKTKTHRVSWERELDAIPCHQKAPSKSASFSYFVSICV